MLATGYVNNLIEKNLNFSEFIWSCARAFGPFLNYKDSDPNCKIKFDELTSLYHEKKLIESNANLKKFEKMGQQEVISYGENKKKEQMKYYQECTEIEVKEIKICQEMQNQVEKWQPSQDHINLKKFMLEQLTTSLKDPNNFAKEQLQSVSKKSPMDFYNDTIKSLKNDVEYHSRESVKEKERNQKTISWLETLYQSVPCKKNEKH